jgi:hypothetical protein
MVPMMTVIPASIGEVLGPMTATRSGIVGVFVRTVTPVALMCAMTVMRTVSRVSAG